VMLSVTALGDLKQQRGVPPRYSLRSSSGSMR
jgi:hypothetical protein